MQKLVHFFMLMALCFMILFPSLSVKAEVNEATLGYKILAKPQNNAKLVDIVEFDVIDGDSLKIELENGDVNTFKLANVYAPKLQHPVTGPQSFANESKARLNELLQSAKDIKIEFLADEQKDSQGRSLIYLWTDKILVQEVMTTEGLTAYYSQDDANSPYLETLIFSEDYAKRNGLNVWSTNETFGENIDVDQYQSNAQNNQVGFSSQDNQAASQNIYFKNCSEAKAAGAAPLYQGEPGYRPQLDRDKDGIACEL
ncbi:thermonuclease family protein [Globicatella sulfidifaciens]